MNRQRSKIIAAARRWIGTPYRHQASLIHVGCDCLGLVRGVWREVIGDEPEAAPPYTPDWAESLGVETLLDAAHRHFSAVAFRDFRPGDVLAFRFRDHLPAKHLGIATSATHILRRALRRRARQSSCSTTRSRHWRATHRTSARR